MQLARLSLLALLVVSLACSDSGGPGSPPADDDGLPDGGDGDLGDLDGALDGDEGGGGDDGAGDTDGDTDAPGDEEPPPTTVAWARLQHPLAYAGAPAATVLTYGRVFHPGVTDALGAGAGIEAELGVGTPDVAPEGWTWTSAAFAGDVDAGANDEYAATLTLPSTPGAYAFAYRFRLDLGPWTYADADGSDDGFSVTDAGALLVQQPPSASVEWGELTLVSFVINDALANGRAVPALRVTAGAPLPVQVVVFAAGVTPGAGRGVGAEVQVGFGPRGVAPDGTWSFADASYVGDADGLGALDDDVYGWAGPSPSVPGDYELAARARLGAGPWTYLDLDGSDDGLDLALPVSVASVPEGAAITWCGLVAPPASLEAAAGESSSLVYAQVAAPGLTGDLGSGPSPLAEVGFGPDGSTPPSGWTFAPGIFNKPYFANDEHVAGVFVPLGTAAGTYDWAWRYSLDGGVSWWYCDADGNAGGAYSPEQAGTLVVP